MAYLDLYPTAADTTEGIRDVWLDGAATTDAVRLALDALVAEGVLLTRRLPDGSLLFARAGERGR